MDLDDEDTSLTIFEDWCSFIIELFFKFIHI
jgi:hypothetical protein